MKKKKCIPLYTYKTITNVKKKIKKTLIMNIFIKYKSNIQASPNKKIEKYKKRL